MNKELFAYLILHPEGIYTWTLEQLFPKDDIRIHLSCQYMTLEGNKYIPNIDNLIKDYKEHLVSLDLVHAIPAFFDWIDRKFFRTLVCDKCGSKDFNFKPATRCHLIGKDNFIFPPTFNCNNCPNVISPDINPDKIKLNAIIEDNNINPSVNTIINAMNKEYKYYYKNKSIRKGKYK